MFLTCSTNFSSGLYRFALFKQMHTEINFLLTERKGRIVEYWPEVVAVRTERQRSDLP